MSDLPLEMDTALSSNLSSPSPSPVAPNKFPTWGYGVILTICGQFTSTAGLLLLKRSSSLESHLIWYQRKYFWLGVLCVFSNGAGIDIVALALAPLSLIAPFAALSIVFSNVLAATGTFVPQEQVTCTAVIANVIIIGGIVLSCYFGPHDSSSHTMAEMANDVTQRNFLIFAIPSLAVVVLYLMATRICGAFPKETTTEITTKAAPCTAPIEGLQCIEEDDHSVGLLNAAESDSDYGTTAAVTLATRTSTSTRSIDAAAAAAATTLASTSDTVNYSAVKCMWCALSSASCAALSQMCLKCVSEAFSVTFAGTNQFVYWETYIPVLGILIIAPLNVKLLDEALEAAPATYGIPVYQSLLVIMTILAGGFFFDEFDKLKTNVQMGCFVGGILLVVCGLGLLSCAVPTAAAALQLTIENQQRRLHREDDNVIGRRTFQSHSVDALHVWSDGNRRKWSTSVSVVTAAASMALGGGKTGVTALTSPTKREPSRRRHSNSL